MLYLETPPQVTLLSIKFMHERGGVPLIPRLINTYSFHDTTTTKFLSCLQIMAYGLGQQEKSQPGVTEKWLVLDRNSHPVPRTARAKVKRPLLPTNRVPRNLIFLSSFFCRLCLQKNDDSYEVPYDKFNKGIPTYFKPGRFVICPHLSDFGDKTNNYLNLPFLIRFLFGYQILHRIFT